MHKNSETSEHATVAAKNKDMVRRIRATMKPEDEIKVFIATRESTCAECGENLGSQLLPTYVASRAREADSHLCGILHAGRRN